MDNVFELHNNLSAEKCEEIIKMFEEDDGKKKGVTGQGMSDVKKSLDLLIPLNDKWRHIDEHLHKQLTEGIGKYMTHLDEVCGIRDGQLGCGYDTGYQIQRTDVGGYYSWHHDQDYQTRRVMTFIWYLNDVDTTKCGGSTAFHPKVGGGGHIRPEQGKLLLFPATWTYIHMGFPIVCTDTKKYICTGWIHVPEKERPKPK